MKTTKRLLSCLLVLAMLFALAIPAFAADDGFSITIENAAQGDTYSLYKVFTATVSKDYNAETGKGISYKLVKPVPEAYKAEFETYFAIDAQGNVSIKKDAQETIKIDGKDTTVLTQPAAVVLKKIAGDPIKVANPAAETQPDGVAIANGTVTFSKLDAGYYIVANGDTAKSWLSVTSLNPSQTIFDKNTNEPTPTDPDGKLKTIDTTKNGTVDSVNGDKNQVTASIGDTLSFKVEFLAPRYMPQNDKAAPIQNQQKVTNYQIVDNATGMTVERNTIKVMIDDEELPEGAYTIAETSNPTTITIPWNDTYANNAKVTVTYDATVTATKGQNSASVNANGTPVIPEDNEKTTVHFTSYGFDLVKTNAEEAILSGAEFELYSADAFDSTTNELKPEAKPLHFDNVNGEYVLNPDGKEVKITAGNVTVAGLHGATYHKVETIVEGIVTDTKWVKDGDSAVYYLREIKAPAGYNALDTLVKVSMDKNNEAVVAGDEYTSGGIQVINERGTVLPSTGGIGTTMFYVIGGILVAAAVVVLVSKKRMGAEQ